jgi:hypothetical protein
LALDKRDLLGRELTGVHVDDAGVDQHAEDLPWR